MVPKNNLIKLNNNDSIDLQSLINTRLLIQANSGGGKSWLLRRILEQSHSKIQQIIIDLEGEFSTLREKHDYILVGKGGDVQIDTRNASLLARKLLQLNASAIIDLYELHHHERKHFLKLFLESMINAPKELWHPCLVIIDEAHVFCPEKGQSEATEAVIDLATRGRKRGFCAVLATQRLSKLHKDAAAECNNKLIGRTGLDIDMKRAYGELGFTNNEQFLSLRKLDDGEFFAFGPAISKEVKKIKIGSVQTTHPKAGSRISLKVTPPTSRVRSILKKLGDLPEEAKQEANTISDLKKEISEYRSHRCPKVTSQEDIGRAVNKALRKKEWEFDKERMQWQKQVKNFFDVITGIGEMIKKVGLPIKIEKTPVKIYEDKEPFGKITDRVERQSPSTIREDMDERGFNDDIVDNELKSIGKGELKILIAIAQQQDGITREHITVLTGYKRSSRDTYLQRLTQRGYINKSGQTILSTEEGIEALGDDYKPLPTGIELQSHYLSTLPKGEREILKHIIEAYPEEISREDLSEITGYQRSSRDTYLQRLNSRNVLQVTNQGYVKASDNLFT